MSIKDQSAIVGVGATPYYKRGESLPQTLNELVGKAILAAVADAGLKITDVDGFAYYSGGFDTPGLAQTLGIPEVKFTAMTTGGGGGSAGCVALASMAIATGQASVVVCVGGMQQAAQRYGSIMASKDYTADNAFFQTAGFIGPGHMFSLLARRHMHLYGTTREHFYEVVLSSRLNAANRDSARLREPLTHEEYFAAPMLADPLCRFDFCLENDSIVACVVVGAERARDMRHPPVYVMGGAHGGNGQWGRSITWMGMPDEYFASSGHRPVAKRVYEMAGISPKDVDVALLYDHFSPMVIMQLEDYGFCGIGEGGQFVADGNIRLKGGSIPVNPHGGQLSECYAIGFTHIREAVEQLRGTAVNQVKDAEIALVTGGPASIPVSSIILRK
jgi:acetyl-CoA acetyltransferase